MFVLGIVFVGLNIVGVAGLAWRTYQIQPAPLLGLGLLILGLLNMISGLGAVLMSYKLGIAAIISGAISAEIGWLVVDYWQKEGGPNWNWHALYISLSIFFIGLLVIA